MDAGTVAPDRPEQDTDPAEDVADMAMTEITGNSETMTSSQGSSVSDFESRSVTPPPPPFTQTVVSQYTRAGRLDSDEPTFSMNVLVITSAVCLVAGAIVGYLLGQVL